MVIRTLVFIALAACSSKKTDDGGGKTERPAPFDVKVNKVEQLDLVAPNQTYIDQGLGKKAPEGKVFVCVQYTVTNTGDQPETLPAPMLIDGKGTQTNISLEAAGSYMPTDWQAETRPGKFEPKTTLKRADCFEVPKDATTKMSLNYFDTGWGPKFKPWHTSVTL